MLLLGLRYLFDNFFFTAAIHRLITLDVHAIEKDAVGRNSHSGLNGYNISDDQIQGKLCLRETFVSTNHSDFLVSDGIV